MDWVQVASIASPIATAVGIIVMRNEARAIAKEIVDEALDSAFARFKVTLLDEMNGKYLRTREQLKDNASYERRLDELETDMREAMGNAPRRRHSTQ